jgi:hypothetical protein
LPRKRYNTAAVDRRRAAVAAWRLRGLSQREITAMLPEGLPDRMSHHTEEVLSWHIEQVVNPNTGRGYDLATINRDLQELAASWRQDASRDFAQLKAHHLASIRYGIRVAWAQNKLYYVFRGLELEAAVLGLHEPAAGADIAYKMGAFLAGVNAATSGDVPDLSEPSESREDRF